MGKTTLLKAIMGLLPARGGTLRFDGIALGGERASGRARLGIGYVPQGRGIFPNLSVRDNIRRGSAAHGRDEETAVAASLAAFPRLARLLDRDGGALSGGEQQLLALARAMVSEPDLVLLDEPTEGIQPSIIDEIAAFLRTANEKQGLAIVLVEQNLEFLTGLAHRILLSHIVAIVG